MSGTCSIDELPFTFTVPISDDGDWLSSTKPKPSLHGFYWALLLSLLIHLLLIQWQPPVYQPQVKPMLTKPIHLTLNYTAPSTPEFVPLQPVITEQKTTKPLSEQPIVVEAPVPVAIEIEPEVTPEPLDDEVLQTIIRQPNRYRDAYMPTTEPSAEFSTATPSGGNNPAREISPRALGPNGFTNIHGNTLVELDNGLCMSATPAQPGQPTNWYLTACGGKKSESEQMMERVNRDFQSRR